MAKVDTLPQYLRPLMEGTSVRTPYCAVCGRTNPLNQHHIVRRSAGKLYRSGVELAKPTITLCGFGNNLSDADGRPYCHGLAHANRLHFRWVKEDVLANKFTRVHAAGGHWEYMMTEEPVRYWDALKLEGWSRLPDVDGW